MRRIMYVENKSGGLNGEGRIGWVEVSRSGRTYSYRGRRLHKTKGGYKYNCLDDETGEAYWISGPHKDGADKLYGGLVQIDEDARVAYWMTVREMPSCTHLTEYRAGVSTRTGHYSRPHAPGHRQSKAPG